MSTVADTYFVNGGTRRQSRGQRTSSTTSACSMGDPESHGPNLSEDDTRSCNSEMGSEVCNVRSRPMHGQSEVQEEKGGRKNKRKNFMPRNIVEYAGSDEEEDHGHGPGLRSFLDQGQLRSTPDSGSIHSPGAEESEEEGADTPLDLSEVQNNSKHLWRKPDFMNASSMSFPGASFLHASRPDLLPSPNPPQSINPQPPSHPFLPFVPMDLRLSALASLADPQGPMSGRRASSDQDYDDSDDAMDESEEGSHVNSISSVNGHHLLQKESPRATRPLTSSSASLLSDFAESTMKELIGLYGIAENLRQAGGKGNSTDIPSLHRHLNATSSEPTSPGQTPNKMMLPENMARLLAAMQESVNVSNNNNASGSRGQNPSSPLSNSSSSGPQLPGQNSYKTHHHSLNNNNHGEGAGENTNSSGFAQKSGNKGGRGKGPSSTGRGLTSFPVIREGLLGKGTGPVDYTRYVRRFASFSECGQPNCRELNYREHFHCHECSHGTRVFVKKEEMIRHFKWHKKRDESLQHGFMRYSPSDDCSDRFVHCPHNRKQTHYHCLQDSCEKVYISTSDVQMHANYHRKDSAIIQEGFQRFRAAEDCGTDHCSFRHQRTTHFHCRRSTCSYTFKNKADMEKHKSYHVKDEQLNRDGFKKFMKHEACPYNNCRFSGICNHIHCIRNGCSYVLHSSGQLYSHKRKHDRRDSELAYRKFKLAQSVMRGVIGADFPALSDSFISTKFEDENSHHSSAAEGGLEPEAEEPVKKFIQACKCDVTPEDHFHCRAESCVNALLGTAEVASEHSRSHELENRISSLAYFTVDPANFDAQDSTIPCVSSKCIYQETELQRKHHHCLWDGCSAVILETDEPFRRLDHFREHERTQKLEVVVPPIVPITVEKIHNDSMDGFFRRKRGRPPKNRLIEVAPGGSNEAIFTSFKLPKPRILGDPEEVTEDVDMKDPIGFLSFPEGSTCSDTACAFNSSNVTGHYHCGHPRCHFSVADVHKLSLHLRDFHTSVDILEGFEYFDRGHADCRQSSCEFKSTMSHFHCLRDGFTFSRYSSMSAHEAECHEPKSNGMSSDDEDKPWPGHSLRSLIKAEPAGHNPMDLSNANGESGESKHVTDHSLSRILQLPALDSSETQYGPQSACGRPFCKLKRKTHYHCHMCNQAFSDLVKLRPHVLKHNAPPQKSVAESDDAESETSVRNDEIEKNGTKIKKEEPLSYPSSHTSSPTMLDASAIAGISPNPSSSYPPTSLSSFLTYPVGHSPYLLYQQNPLSSIYAGMMFGGTGSGTPFPVPPSPALSPPSPTLGSLGPLSPPKRTSSSGSSPSSPPENKKQRLQLRILKDEPVPEGYVRFRFNEDCSFVHCGYREHQTHFHCTREDCGYSFCDKTRFVQHTARHERLDTLMGGDFKQYRANVSCGRPACTYVPTTGTAPTSGSAQGQNKASHFHCSKCDFVCTDTNKVVAHRRAHQKLDSINAAGFEKYTPSQNCHIDGCAHAQKQTHYHCLRCSYAVVGLSQMSAHKYRHTD